MSFPSSHSTGDHAPRSMLQRLPHRLAGSRAGDIVGEVAAAAVHAAVATMSRATSWSRTRPSPERSHQRRRSGAHAAYRPSVCRLPEAPSGAALPEAAPSVCRPPEVRGRPPEARDPTTRLRTTHERTVWRRQSLPDRPCGPCPRQDSNLRPRLRRAVLYPLSYGGSTLRRPSCGRLMCRWCRMSRLEEGISLG